MRCFAQISRPDEARRTLLHTIIMSINPRKVMTGERGKKGEDHINGSSRRYHLIISKEVTTV